MRKIVLALFVVLLSYGVGKAQNYNAIVNYNLNGTPVNGVKIKTNLPYVNTSQMPTVKIEGYNHGTARPINISLVWYIFDGAFINYSATTSGAYAPEIKLSNEDDKVVIFINDKQYYQRFTVSVFAQGMSEVAAWFAGWTTADEPLTGTNTVTFSYYSPVSTADGNVGIGTTNPSDAKLQINGQNDLLSLRPNNNGAAQFNAYLNNDFRIIQRSYAPLTLWTNTTERMRIDKDGNVAINTSDAKDYKLAVNGPAIFTKAVVKNYSNWPDYVFDSTYQLPSLDSVSTFIQTNKHLPDMPSAATVEKDGHDLGEVQKMLLKKMEEMTLYMIELKKQNELILQENKQLKSRIEKMENK